MNAMPRMSPEALEEIVGRMRLKYGREAQEPTEAAEEPPTEPDERPEITPSGTL
jgi:hypothetical protein